MKQDVASLSQAFGVALRKQRNARGLSQQGLALQSGLDRTYISLLERGLRQPTLATLFALATVLQVSPSELIATIED